MSAISNIEDFKKEPIISQVNDLLVHYKQSHDDLYKQKAAIVRGELEELTKLRALVKDAKNMAEFYGEKDHWSAETSNRCSSMLADDHEDVFRDSHKGFVAGRHAREFLSKHKELVKEEV
jgi:hypothetical protein